MANPLVKEEDETMEEPLLSNYEPTKGGFRTLPFILANEAFEKVANSGLKPNMILYLTREYGLRAAMASNVIFLWSAATDFTPILWAFLADTYVGRYPTIAFGSIVCFLGMVILWFTALIPQARPYCDQFNLICKNPAASQLFFLYSSYGLMAIGAGGIRSCSVAFGADQLDNRRIKKKNAGNLESYFSWYIAMVNASVLVALTCVVYVQEHFGWKVGFGVPCILMLLSAISFFLASPLYAKLKPNSSVLTGLAQVGVASYKNKDIVLSSSDENHEYYYIKGSMSKPSEKLRFLNKACIIRNPRQNICTSDGGISDPWRLCTVNQVEQLKSVIRIIPIWSTAILVTLTIYCQSSYTVLQAKTMDRHLTSSFEIPAGSFNMFTVISSTLWLGFYNSIALPIASKIKGKSVRLSSKKRIGVGIFITSISMATSAIVEGIRRQKAIQLGFEDDPHAVINMSALWLLPQYIILGISEAFNAAGQIEFYYSELPKSMSSIAITLCLLASSIASFVASLMMSIVDSITKTGNQESWLSDNLNKGHYDYYCWLLFGICVVSFVYYIACSRAYGPCQGEESKDISGDEVSDEH